MTTVTATIGVLVDEVSGRLRRGGVEHPRREAHRLVGDLAELGSGASVLHPERAVPGGLRDRVLAAADRRANGEPIAYVTGRAGFRHLELAVDHRVLIPRPETEQLVDLVLAEVPHGRIVDVGTGSGCIALSLAAEGHGVEVTGIDRSPEALAVARTNALRLGLVVEWLEGDLLGPVQGRRFDVVVSNPPYLATEEYRVLDASVRAWEPEGALVGGADGLEVIRRILAEALEVVRPGGLLALEIDSSRAAATVALAAAAGWQDVAVIRDLFGRDRFLTARRGLTR
jgi:release factor glutamine methyltransferase